MKMNKKGIIENLMGLVVPIIGIAIVLVVGFLVIAESKSQLQNIQGINASGQSSTYLGGTAAWNATSTTQNAIGDIPGWLPIIVITVIGALLIGLVTRFRRQ